MSNFDTLKGVSNFADTDLIQLLAASYIMFLDWGLLNVGAFTNVKLNDSNINLADRSKLRLSNDPQYTIGQVWETARSNLVWESGVASATQPIQISGVYVNNTFYPLSTVGAFKHHIEYTTGRVVFDTAIATTSTVKLEHAFKQINVLEAKDCTVLRDLQFRTFDPYNNNYTQSASGDYSKNPNNRVQLPLIGVETTPKIMYQPYELGNFVNRVHTDMIFHVLAENDSDVKKLVNILSLQKESTTFILNMDAIAKSGMFPLSYNGSLNPNPKTYPNLVAVDAFKYAKTFSLNTEGNNSSVIATNLYHGSVRTTVETIY